MGEVTLPPVSRLQDSRVEECRENVDNYAIDERAFKLAGAPKLAQTMHKLRDTCEKWIDDRREGKSAADSASAFSMHQKEFVDELDKLRQPLFPEGCI